MPLCARALAKAALLPVGVLTMATLFAWVLLAARPDDRPGQASPTP